MLYTTLTVVLMVLVMTMIIGKYSGWGKTIPNIVKILIPVVVIFLFLLKTVLMIPILNIICIANGPVIA